jgi:uncharacterized coiled-coil protein SlyX
MVKIPSLDDLKKMGSGLIDSAKSVKLNEMVDKFKSGIESVNFRKNASSPVEAKDEDLNQVFAGIYISLKELADAQAAQANATKKIQTQLNVLTKILENYQKTTVSPPPPVDPQPPMDNDVK